MGNQSSERQHSALLLVDVINPFDFEGGEALARETRRVLPGLRRLRGRFDKAGRAVIYVNDNFAQWNTDFRQLVAMCSHPESPGSDVAKALAPRATDYFVLKPRHSGFFASPLPVLLEQLHIGRVVVAGIAADSCVLATTLDAHARGLVVEVASDAVAARSGSLCRNALAVIRRSGAARVHGSSRTRP